MPDTAPTDPILALVHQGWDHLKLRRPIAAWASWRLALRLQPGQEAAAHALDVLAGAGDLPAAARVEYRFLTPADPARRVAWDSRFQGRDLEQLDQAAGAFAALAEADPSDSQARFNQGLCLAWLGRNAESVAALDLAVRAMADGEPETAVQAWALAEILRVGAEALADDLNHVATIAWTPGGDPSGFLDGRPEVCLLPAPEDPITGRPVLGGAELAEWLDGALDEGSTTLRRVLATVVRLPGSLRLSGPDPVLLEGVVEEVRRAVGPRIASIRREATPLPLAFLDAAVWAVRMPPGLDDEARAALNRSAVERYYEATWIHRARQGLDGRTPAEAGRVAREGDAVASVKLRAVVLVREQLGARPTTLALYQAYPFDLLRRRLGLEPVDPLAIDPHDAASMSGPELDALDPSALDDYPLADAYESAAALGEDARTARFAGVLAGRDPSTLARLDRRALFAILVREALAGGALDEAILHLDRAQVVDQALSGGDRRTFETWKAEASVRLGAPARAVAFYRGLLAEEPDPAFALEAAEFLLGADLTEEARALAGEALELGIEQGEAEVVDRARVLLFDDR